LLSGAIQPLLVVNKQRGRPLEVVFIQNQFANAASRDAAAGQGLRIKSSNTFFTGTG
jgi:hypothetical protein